LSAARATSANGASIAATGIAGDPSSELNKKPRDRKERAPGVRVFRTKKEGRLD
jgi:hypothetical protein